jgi:hypothetical protein
MMLIPRMLPKSKSPQRVSFTKKTNAAFEARKTVTSRALSLGSVKYNWIAIYAIDRDTTGTVHISGSMVAMASVWRTSTIESKERKDTSGHTSPDVKVGTFSMTLAMISRETALRWNWTLLGASETFRRHCWRAAVATGYAACRPKQLVKSGVDRAAFAPFTGPKG